MCVYNDFIYKYKYMNFFFRLSFLKSIFKKKNGLLVNLFKKIN